MNKLFLSTPSARRATQGAWNRRERVLISIHALCEEGDFTQDKIATLTAEFLSTPSARRATCLSGGEPQRGRISIHALCEEGDHRGCCR